MAVAVAGMFDQAVENRHVRRVAGAAAAALVYWAVLRRIFNPPAGVLLQGIVVGGLTALIAFGLALVYRANRIINFAQGDLGGVPASLGVLPMLSTTSLPYLVAFPLTIVSAVVLGAFVEFVFIRRFFKAPRLILTVVTIGVSQILAVFPVAMPRWFGLQTSQNRYPSPIDLSFDVGGRTFGGNEVIALVVVPIVIGALAAFFRFTNIGIAVRASAESADRASLLGIPVRRVQTVVWMVAAGLAFVAVFL
ncbi:MAG TPA: branched-chain amino acid ABC transporter permease, partial [Acidimicrobiales bacterium]